MKWHVALLSSLLAASISAQDCSDMPICARMKEAPVIFIGALVEKRTAWARFSVDEVIRGLPQNTRNFESSILDDHFRGGEKYLVIAERFPDNAPLVGACSGSRPITQAQRDLSFLREWMTGKNVTRIQGRIAPETGDGEVAYELDQKHAKPVTNVEVIAESNGQEFKAHSGPDGSFQIDLPSAGDYFLTVHHPGYISTEDAYEISVEENQCAEQNIGLWFDNVVSGRLLDVNHRPVRGIPVEIQDVKAAANAIAATIETDEYGRYEIRRLPAGNYVLGVNISGSSRGVPYVTRFYPGVSTRDRAVPIHIDGPNRIVDRDFTIEDREQTRHVLVKIEWSDGSPVTNASVTCRAKGADQLVERYTDAAGEVVFPVLSSRAYEIEVTRLFWSKSVGAVEAFHTLSKVTLNAGNEDAFVEITISKVNDLRPGETPRDLSQAKPESHLSR